MNRRGHSGRTDANQSDIVKALLAAGCSVQSLASVGLGTPDLLAGRAGINYVLEVKDGNRIPSERVLTADEKKWHGRWQGQVAVVENVEQALEACGILAAIKARRAG